MPTLLIADDSQQKIEFLQSVLRHCKWHPTVITAKTTDEAKQLIDAQRIDYAWIDYEMPRENGIVVIAYLRLQQPESKIALVTSLSDSKYKEESAKAGANAFVCTALPQDQSISALKDLILEWSTDAIA